MDVSPEALVSETPEPAAPTPLTEPREGVPAVLESAEDVAALARRIAGGTGPLAVDTERASGYRYSNRAYLIQLRRAGSGSALLDPTTTGTLQLLAEVINPLEWVLHSADQDLPCLAELGLRPARLYDTELAGRLANLPRVNLAAMVEHQLGLSLAKGHGAADWSTRPLPDNWLNYAALDVEVLLELRDAIDADLASQGKADWAAQEFEHIRISPPPGPKPDRWRRTSDIHNARGARQLAAVRELWLARDEVAAQIDRAPGRVLPDSAIVAAAVADPKTAAELQALKVFGGPRQKRRSGLWLDALARARALPTRELPTLKPVGGIPAPNRWSQHRPEAAHRLSTARKELAAVSEQVAIPAENLLSPKLLRELCWEGLQTTADVSAEDRTADEWTAAVQEALIAGQAREWQRALVTPALVTAFTAPVPAEPAS
ncbi:ribonuclease D [Tomitella biformata]|uniref:ribonuclease D n=1 Tax=Tomitella biformata TaxID=630403 RepID=UPI000A0709F1|nr:ribonuclease D [Tomitella biformata]